MFKGHGRAPFDSGQRGDRNDSPIVNRWPDRRNRRSRPLGDTTDVPMRIGEPAVPGQRIRATRRPLSGHTGIIPKTTLSIAETETWTRGSRVCGVPKSRGEGCSSGLRRSLVWARQRRRYRQREMPSSGPDDRDGAWLQVGAGSTEALCGLGSIPEATLLS